MAKKGKGGRMEAEPKMKRKGIGFSGKLSVKIEYREDHQLTVKEFRMLQAFLKQATGELWKEIIEEAVIDYQEKRDVFRDARKANGDA